MKHRIGKVFRFEAAHVLPRHEGKCARMHGHSYKVEVEFAADGLIRQGPETGMVKDFDKVKMIVHKLLPRLDHFVLNDALKGMAEVPIAYSEHPTAEHLAQFFFEEIDAILTAERDPARPQVWIDRVRIWETETSWWEYGR